MPTFSGDDATFSAIASSPVHFGASASSDPLVQARIPMINPAATTIAAMKGGIFLFLRAGWELIIENAPSADRKVHYPAGGGALGARCRNLTIP
ncbi:hypothetical protein ACIOD2_20415 [Amycolatopsis sp. NPDC088138]|uniref:hypothetical protein n=1 Tax=Amycolatopsis sp. NPDC088138 TaxID=3363938 RepID=UPI0038010087